jgi:pterin-4a-carbinolamine dehydratase
MDFVNSAAHIINEQEHYPDIHISYNKVHLRFTMHKSKRLTLNDFIMAAKMVKTIGQ